jgi:hypothetical protein
VLVCRKPFQPAAAVLHVKVKAKKPGRIACRDANHGRAWAGKLAFDFHRVMRGVLKPVLRHRALVRPAGKDRQAHFLGKP